MSTNVTPRSEKEIALDAVRTMPDSATLREILEELAILEAIRRGEADLAAGRVVSHDEVKRRSATWISR